MKKKMCVAVVLCMCVAGMLPPLALGETVIVDDHFDDGAIGTNTTGIGTGFNSGVWSGGAVITESGTTVTLENSEVAWARVSITSIEGAAIGTVARFEFRGVSFSQSPNGWDWGGTTDRLALGVKDTNAATDYDAGLWPGFYVQPESDSMMTGVNSQFNGISTLFYRSAGGVNTPLATWSFDTLNWDDWANFAATANFTPVLNLTLDISSTSYMLTIEGDSITLLSGSLSGSFASAGITNELTTGYAFAYAQTENPSLFTAIDQIIIKEDAAVGPHSPEVLPNNGDGTSGTLQPNNQDVVVTLTFKAAGDPNILHEPPLPVNPDIVGHYIYLSKGIESDDPNVHLLDYIGHTHNVDPYLTDPNVSYGPITLVGGQGKTFYWQVEEALEDPDNPGNPCPAGEPNNISGAIWSFIAVGAEPHILTGPEHAYADENGDASFVITTGSIANNFRWFKVVGEQDTAENGDDVKLSDSGIYSGTQTKTLAITGGTTGNGAEGQYYCIAYNGDPEGVNIASDPSPAAWLWIPRLVNYYPFETLTEGITPDSESGFDMTMLSNDTGLDVPALEANVLPELTGSTYSLKFDNPRLSDPNHFDAQYAQVNEGWAGGYQDITISTWVYSLGGSNWNRILDYGNDNANYTFLCVNPGSVNRAVRFAVNVNGTEQGVTSPAEVLPDNEWTFVTATLAGNTGRIYINGELVATNTSLTNDPVSFGPTTQNWLGRSQWGAGDGYFNGMLDELKIYNYALSSVEIAQIYADIMNTSVCNREGTADMEFDTNDDCKVDLTDFVQFVTDWLNDNRIYPQ